MDEQWKSVDGWNGYEVSDQGNLRSWVRDHGRGIPRVLKGGHDKDGYRRAVLCAGGKRGFFKVGNMVATAFIGYRPDGLVLRHLDGNKLNNKASNLAWSTQKVNINDMWAHGTMRFGENHQSAKLTEKEVKLIHSSPKSLKQLATQFNVSVSTCSNIKTGRSWKCTKYDTATA